MEFLELSPLEIARQMTIVDSYTFRRIKLSEFQGQAWNKEETKAKKSPNVTDAVENFNKVNFEIEIDINISKII